MSELLGRFHPLIVHLPIGILVLAFLMEHASRYKKYAFLKSSTSFVLLVAMLTTLFAWFTGWIMPKEGEFGENLVGRHFWASTGLLITCIILYVSSLYRTSRLGLAYLPLLYLSMILLAATGHYGGSLTHGEDHLTSPLGKAPLKKVTDVNALSLYTDIIQPILKQKCYSCHNEGKQKGGFIMTDTESLIKGGDEGISIVAGDHRKSPLTQRIHLPLDDKKHMPPKGKRQLNPNELMLLEWWIDSGASFDEIVGNIKQSEEIQGILKSYETNDADPDPAGLAMITQAQISELAEDGISVSRESETSPFIHVNLSRIENLSKKQFKRLSKIKNHIKSLDLSFSNMNDQLMTRVVSFKNLCVLKLQHTNISSEGISHLEKLTYLKSLNLYGTSIDDEAFVALEKMPALSKLYLWQTKVTTKGVEEFAAQKPMLGISHEIDQSLFGDARLKPPIITAAADIFEDSLEITMSLNFKNVDVFYTLDGTDPDSTSMRYDTVFNIYKTAPIKAISSKAGWETSEPVEKLFIKAGHTVASVSLLKQPSSKYKAKGAKSLIDFEKGSESFVDGKWLGFEGEDMTATLDLGKAKKVSNVVVSALESTASYIFFPKRIVVSSSVDNRSFKPEHAIDIPIVDGPVPPRLKSFLLSFEETNARYVRVKVFGTLKNPEWHSAPGAKNWIFIDEMMVN